MVPLELATELAAALQVLPCTCRVPSLSWPSMRENVEGTRCRRCITLEKWDAWIKAQAAEQ